MANKLYYPQRPKGLPIGYDSWPEYRLHTTILSNEKYHPEKIEYTVSRKYEPDFEIEHKGGKYLIEFKGYFRDNQEASKYTWISKVLPNDTELLFVFDRPDKPIHFRARRSDGTKQTHGEWADKNGFRYFDENSFIEFYKKLEK